MDRGALVGLSVLKPVLAVGAAPARGGLGGQRHERVRGRLAFADMPRCLECSRVFSGAESAYTVYPAPMPPRAVDTCVACWPVYVRRVQVNDAKYFAPGAPGAD